MNRRWTLNVPDDPRVMRAPPGEVWGSRGSRTGKRERGRGMRGEMRDYMTLLFENVREGGGRENSIKQRRKRRPTKKKNPNTQAQQSEEFDQRSTTFSSPAHPHTDDSRDTRPVSTSLRVLNGLSRKPLGARRTMLRRCVGRSRSVVRGMLSVLLLLVVCEC